MHHSTSNTISSVCSDVDKPVFLWLKATTRSIPLPDGWWRSMWCSPLRCWLQRYRRSWRTEARPPPPAQRNLRDERERRVTPRVPDHMWTTSVCRTAALTAVSQCDAVRSVEGQRGSDHLQLLSFLLNFGHQEHVGEQQGHHLQLHVGKNEGVSERTPGEQSWSNILPSPHLAVLPPPNLQVVLQQQLPHDSGSDSSDGAC